LVLDFMLFLLVVFGLNEFGKAPSILLVLDSAYSTVMLLTTSFTP